MSVETFKNINNGPFKRYCVISRNIGSDVKSHSELVDAAFQYAVQFITLTNTFKSPKNPNDTALYLSTIQEEVNKVKQFKATEQEQFKHNISTINESIDILTWFTQPEPMKYVENIRAAVQTHIEHVLKESKSDERHIIWANAWLETLEGISTFVRRYHHSGLMWSGQKSLPATALLGDIPEVSRNFDHTPLFKEIDQNYGTRQEPIGETTSNKPVPANKRSDEIFIQEGKKWRIEHQKQNHNNLIIQNANTDNVVYIYNCFDCTVLIESKINVIKLDTCKKVSVLFTSLISGIEVLDCKDVQLHCFGILPSLTIDSSNNINLSITRRALEVQVLTCHSSDVYISFPMNDGYYKKFKVPSQLVTRIDKTNNINTELIKEC